MGQRFLPAFGAALVGLCATAQASDRAAVGVRVAPTTIRSGMLHQTVAVALTPAHRMPRGARVVAVLAGRRAAVDVGGLAAGAHRRLILGPLDLPFGRHRLTVRLARPGARTVTLWRGGVRAIGATTLRNRRPGRVLGGAGLTPHTRALVGDEVDVDVNSETDDQEETYVAVQPNSPRRVIVAVNPAGTADPAAWISDNFMRPGTVVGRALPDTVRRPAADGGGTTALAAGTLCCDPALAADTLGNLWYAVVAESPTFHHVVIDRIAPGTTTFQPVGTAIPARTNDTQDKEMITIDHWESSPKQGTLYAVWTENNGLAGQQIVISQCSTRPDASACDDPDNWSAPTPVTDAAGLYLYASVAAAPNGDVYVTWWDYAAPPAGNRISIDRCRAGSDCRSAGAWGPDTLVHSLNPEGGAGFPSTCPMLAAPSRGIAADPSVDVGPDGTVWVATSDLNGDGTTICTGAATDDTVNSLAIPGSAPGAFPRSANARRVKAAAVTFDAFYPALTVDPDTGEVAMTFYLTDSSRTVAQQTLL